MSSNLWGYVSAGGLLYFFIVLFRLWKDNTIKQDIINILNFLPDLISKDVYFDIVSGCAGCLMILLKLHGIIPEEILNPLIELCVQHLLTHYPDPAKFPLVTTPIKSTQPLLGYSHGVAGIALVLSQYDSIKPSLQIKKWITEALIYERNCYSLLENNWPDYRIHQEDIHPRFMTAWCHGAPGIGLARLEMKNYFEDADFNEEIKNAVFKTLSNGFGSYHNLCHGNVGQLDLLLNVSHSMQDDSLKAIYFNYVASVIQSIKKNGLSCSVVSAASTPGLMAGIAGVAYQFMRIVYPDKIPSVLLLK